MSLLFSIAAAYLFGSIPFGLFVGKWVKGIDVREHGSKNIGTTNVFRVIGKKWGLVVFFLDAFKGYLGVVIACAISNQSLGSGLSYVFAVAAIMGHTFPVWLSFKGGKGVATSLGVFLAAAFMPTLLTFGMWIAIFTWTHIVSISSLVAAVTFVVLSTLAVLRQEAHFILLPISALLCAFMFYTHRENIKRLKKNEEKRLF